MAPPQVREHPGRLVRLARRLGRRRGASKTAFPRGPWERVVVGGSRRVDRSLRSLRSLLFKVFPRQPPINRSTSRRPALVLRTEANKGNEEDPSVASDILTTITRRFGQPAMRMDFFVDFVPFCSRSSHASRQSTDRRRCTLPSSFEQKQTKETKNTCL